jgi:hypothetical protein
MGSHPEPVIINGASGRRLSASAIGCGGAGCNILAEGQLDAVPKRIAFGTAPDAMAALRADRRLLAVPANLERDASLDAGAAKLAGSKAESELAMAIGRQDVVFVLAGLGGLSGGWGAVLGARAASSVRSMSVSVVTVPFSVESDSRRARAAEQLKRLAEHSDCVIAVQNDMILAEAPSLPINRAFRVMNSVLASPVNLMLRSIGSDDLPSFRRHLAGGMVWSMDSAEWDRENADFAVVERLSKSGWLDMAGKPPSAAMLFVDGGGLHGDLEELCRLFSRAAGKNCRMLVAGSGERATGLRVTAVVGR